MTGLTHRLGTRAGASPSLLKGAYHIVCRLLHRLVAEDAGQDLIEYALLTGAIGFCAVVTFNLLGGIISAVYTSWGIEVNSLWEPPAPE